MSCPNLKHMIMIKYRICEYVKRNFVDVIRLLISWPKLRRLYCIIKVGPVWSQLPSKADIFLYLETEDRNRKENVDMRKFEAWEVHHYWFDNGLKGTQVKSTWALGAKRGDIDNEEIRTSNLQLIGNQNLPTIQMRLQWFSPQASR